MPGAIAEKKRELLFCCLIAAAALLAYSQFFGTQLMEFDAVSKIASHSRVDARGFLEIFTQPEEHYISVSTNYRPVQTLIQWVVFALSGMNFTAFHALGFALHALNTALVFLLAKKIIRDNSGFFSAFAALVFALHPIGITAVLFVSRLHELLICFSLLASLLLLMKFFEGKKRGFFALSVLLCAIGVFSKETGALIPIVLFVYAAVFSEEKKFARRLQKAFRLCVPFFALIALYAATMFFALGKFGGYAQPVPYLRSQVIFYLLSFIFYPVDLLKMSVLDAGYYFFGQAPADLFFLVCIGAIALAALWGLSEREGDKKMLFLSAWFMLFLFFYTAAVLVQPWYAYVPLVPFSIILGILLKNNLPRAKNSPASLAVSALILLLFLSLAALSPLFSAQDQQAIAGKMTVDVFEKTVRAAGELPQGSTLYLVNYPVYILLPEKGFMFPTFLLNGGSVQAMLDFRLPEKKFKTVLLTGIIVNARQFGEKQFSLEFNGNCSFSIAGSAPEKARIFVPPSFGSEKYDGIAYVPPEGIAPKIGVAVPQEKCAGSFFLFFDGSRVQVLGPDGAERNC